MEKDLALGPEAKASLKFVGDKLVIGIDYAGKQASGSVSVSIDIDQFAGMLKDAIPGKIDDMIIDTLVAAAKVIP